MKYFVVYEFNNTLESKFLGSKEEVETFIKDEENELCQDGEFIKYYIVSGDFEVTSGFKDRT